MSRKVPVKVILGTHTVGDTTVSPGIVHFDKPEDVKNLLDAFYSRGYRELDTASLYQHSEERLGRAEAPSRFVIHTKVRSGNPGDLEPSKIRQSVEKSLADLRTSEVETMFLHLPDRQTPLQETAKIMDELARQGKFRKYGLSNYSPEEVEAFLAVCEEHGYVKPSVYQGHYNALARGGEETLFPLLRKHGMAFFAYSAAAAGVLAERNPSSARWSDNNPIGKIYSTAYGHPAVQAAVSRVREAAAKYGINGHAAALRWTAFHGILEQGDAIIFTVSKLSQLHSNLDALEAGPLPDELADSITEIWASVKDAGLWYHI